MSIRILTLKEAEKVKALCERCGECFEMETGLATQDYICDNSDDQIPAGTECAAVMVLPFKSHPNYKHQKKMLKDYLVKK